MLAPAVMINACALLLLGIGNKYSSMMHTIRVLNNDKRRYLDKVKENHEMDYFEVARFQSIVRQINELQDRLRLVRNVIIYYAIALFLFIFTSLLIGVEALVTTTATKYIFLSTFILGIFAVAIGLIYFLTDTLKAYNVINLELKAEE